MPRVSASYRFPLAAYSPPARGRSPHPHMSVMRILPVVLLCRSPHLLLKIRNIPILPAIPPRHEGRYGQSSRNVRRGAMDAWGAPDERSPCIRRNRVVPMPRRWHQVGGRAMSALRVRHASSADDGGYQARHSGEIAYKPSNHRAGNAGLFGVPVVTCLRAFLSCTQGCGCDQHPAFPAPSLSEGAKLMASPGAWRRGKDRACLYAVSGNYRAAPPPHETSPL